MTVTTKSTSQFALGHTVGPFSIHLTLSSIPCVQQPGTYWFGAPVGTLTKKQPQNIDGYFLMVSATDNECLIVNDTCGGFRLYRYQHENDLYLSDDYEHLLVVMRQHGGIERDIHEYRYWQKHRYTTGGRTFVRRLDKLPPATTLRITEDGISEHCYFEDRPSTPDARKQTDAIRDSLLRTIKFGVSKQRRTLLFFSGGADSTLLALLLKEAKQEFTPILCVPSPMFAQAHTDACRAREVAKQLGLKLVELSLELDFDQRAIEPIAREMLFDRHIALIHFAAMKEIRRIYGTDVTIINGQAADSILSYGPSQQTRGDLAARALLFAQGTPLASAAAAMVRTKHGKQYRKPNKAERALAFFDQLEYYSVLDRGETPEYYEYLAALVEPIRDRLKNEEACRMYLKLYGFLQGSDNQVVLRSARAVGIEHVLMPFTSPDLIRATIQYREPWRELVSPKYAVRNILKELGYQPPLFTVSKRSDLVSLNDITNRVDQVFDQTVAKLFS